MSKEIGKCLCGQIGVTCTNLPRSVIACYCTDCQKATGGGPSFNIVVDDNAIAITKGKTSFIKVTASSGNPVERHFCPKCGSPIFSKLPNRTVWKAGIFNHVKNFFITKIVWRESANISLEKNNN